MAITTLDGALAGFQPLRLISKVVTPTLVVGRPHSLWNMNGIPGAGSHDATLNGAVLSSSSTIPNGAIPHVDPGSGNAYIGRIVGYCANPGALLWCDRLWSNGGITITSTGAQAITSPTWPARDLNGSSNGDGVLLAVEVSAATGAGTPTITISYTNQAGTSGRTATNLDATVASSAIGAFYRIGLQAGDTGVRSVQSITLSATWNSGTINLVAYRLLATMECVTTHVPTALDVLTGGFIRLHNGVVPFLVFLPSATTASLIGGSWLETHG